MSRNLQLDFKLVALIFILVFPIAFIISGCEPGGCPIINNQRNENVRIYVITVKEDDISGQVRDYGIVPANTTKELAGITFVKPEWVYRIQAEDPSGEVVFSHDYNYYDLEEISWRITIPP